MLNTINNTVRRGSVISFYGTQHTVNSIVSDDEIRVKLNNGVLITLWWTDRAGCEVIEY